MSKQRKTKSQVRRRPQQENSPSIDGDIDTKQNSRTAGNQFHPINSGFTDHDQLSDMESAQYVRKNERTHEADSDAPPRFIDNDNKFKSAMEGNNLSPSHTIEGKFRLGGMMESDIEESGNMPQKMGLDQSFSTEKSAKDNLDQTETRRQRPKTAHYTKQSHQTRTSPQNKSQGRHQRVSTPKPGFLMQQNATSETGYQINQKIRKQKKETYNKILEKAYIGMGMQSGNQTKSYNQFTNRSRKLVSKHIRKQSHSSKKNQRFSYPAGDDTDSLNMKQTMNDHLSDNTFDVPQKKQNQMRNRVQSAHYKENIEEIQEEAFSSINIKTQGASFTENEQEESAKLLEFYKHKFANQEKNTKSAISIKEQRKKSVSSVKSSQSFHVGFAKEDLADKLYDAKIKLNKVTEEKKTLGTQNKNLKREIQANEKVIQMMLKNQSPSTSTQSMNHYSLMMQHKRKLRETLQENNNLRINIDQMRKDMRNTKEAELKTENQALLIQTQTMQFNIKRLQDYIIELKEKLQVQVKTNLASSDNVEQYELKAQISDYKKITKKQEQTVQNLEKNNFQLQEEIKGFHLKIEQVKHKFETKESKLQFKISQQESDMSTLSQLKRQIESQKTELKSNKIVIESYKPKMDILIKDKVQLVKERDFLNGELTNGMKNFKQQLKEKNKEIIQMNDEIESKLKSVTSKHNKEVNQLNNKLNKSLGQNRNLDEMLLQKETNFSAETKYKVIVKRLENEVESLTESLRLVSKKTRGVTPKKKKKVSSSDYDQEQQQSSNQLQSEQKILEKEYAIEKLMTKVGQLENKNKELITKLNQKLESNKNLILERNSSEEHDVMASKNSDALNLNLKSTQEIENLNQEIESLKQQLSDQEKLNLEIENLKESLGEQEKNNLDTAQELNQEIESMRLSLAEKEEAIEQSSKDLEDAQKQLEEKEQEVEQINNTKDALQEALQERNDEFEQLQLKYDSGEMDRDNLEIEVQNHLNNIKEKESQLEDAQGEIMNLNNNNDKFKDKDENVHYDKNQLIEEQKDQIELIKQQIQQIPLLEQQVESLDAEIVQIKQKNESQVEEFETQIKEMTKKEEDLKQQIAANDEKMNELESIIQAKEEIANAGDKDEKQMILDQQIQEHEEKVEEIHQHYNSQIETHQAHIEELKEQISSTVEEKQQLAEQKEQEQKNYQEQIDTHIERIDDLCKQNDSKDIEMQEQLMQYNMLNDTKNQSPEQNIENQLNNEDNEGFKLQYLEVKNHLEQAIFEKDQLQSQVESLKNEKGVAGEGDQSEKLAQLELENNDLRDQIEKMEQDDFNREDEGTSKKSDHIERSSSGQSIKDENQTLQDTALRYKNEMIEAKDQSIQFQQNAENMTADIRDLKLSIVDKQNDLDRLKQDLKNEQNDLQELKNDNFELKSEIKNKDINIRKLTSDLDKASEAKNQLMEKLLAEKDSKSAIIQQFAQLQESGMIVGGSPKNVSKKDSKKMKKEIEVETPMSQVVEEESRELTEDEEEEHEEVHQNLATNHDEEDDQIYNDYVEYKSEDSNVPIDNANQVDANPDDIDDYEQLYLKANKELKSEESLYTIDEMNQSQRTGKSHNESVLGFLVEENPVDPRYEVKN